MVKRGELSFQFVVTAALLLIVFIVILVIVTGQLQGLSGSFFQLGGDASSRAKGDKCLIWFSHRECAGTDGQLSKEYYWEEIKPYNGTWADCKDKCFERGKEKT